MKITILDKQPGEEDEIIIKCDRLDNNVMDIVNLINSSGKLENAGHFKMKLYKQTSIFFVDTSDILYCESVDDRVFVYTDTDVYEVKQKLYMLEQELPKKYFIRANKALIVNIDKIDTLSPALGSRFEATLKNNYKVIFSRMYADELKIRLGLKDE